MHIRKYDVSYVCVVSETVQRHDGAGVTFGVKVGNLPRSLCSCTDELGMVWYGMVDVCDVLGKVQFSSVQPPMATGAPSQTSTIPSIPYHTYHTVIPYSCMCVCVVHVCVCALRVYVCSMVWYGMVW